MYVIFRHATGEVRVMMLHADVRNVCHFERKTRAEIAGMQIAGDRARRDAEESLHVRQRLFEEFQRFEVFKIADVLAQDRVGALGEAERVLEFSADREKFVDRAPEFDRLRSVAAGAANQAFLAFERAQNGIVHTGLNAAIVQDRVIDEIRKAWGFLILADDGLFGEIPAGHY